MNLSEFPSIQDKPSKSNLQKKIKQSNDIQDAIDKFKSSGGVCFRFWYFYLIIYHATFRTSLAVMFLNSVVPIILL